MAAPVDEFADGGEGATTDRFLGDDVEPYLDLIEPGGVGRGEVDVVARASGKPALNLRVLMGAMIINDPAVRGGGAGGGSGAGRVDNPAVPAPLRGA